jgi:putative restriction endonuclease
MQHQRIANMGEERFSTRWEELIAEIRPGNSGDERAVHKPLLVLMLLARAHKGLSNEVRFKDIEQALDRAIQRFGSAPKPGGPEMPFWHLKNDGFWVVQDEDAIPKRKQGDRPTRTGLRDHHATGFVPLSLWKELLESPDLVENLARQLLEQCWPASHHQAILGHVGLRLSR